jgi:prepilin-type N-terminal cleavage/methylation domain-containing protein
VTRASEAARPRSLRPPTGFSLLELVIVVCIVAVLLAIAADRLLVMRTSAERTSVETTIGNIRSALGIKVARLIAKGDLAGIHALAQSNPMDVLAEPPESYRGVYFGIDPALFTGGDWYYDRRDRTLAYVVKYEDVLRTARSAGAPPPLARYTISLVYDDVNGNKTFDAGVDLATGVRLKAVGDDPWSAR